MIIVQKFLKFFFLNGYLKIHAKWSEAEHFQILIIGVSKIVIFRTILVVGQDQGDHGPYGPYGP